MSVTDVPYAVHGEVAVRRKTASAIEVPKPGVGQNHSKRIPAIFFRTEAGGEPLREWLRGLPPEDRKRIGEDVKTVEFGWPIRMPV